MADDLELIRLRQFRDDVLRAVKKLGHLERPRRSRSPSTTAERLDWYGYCHDALVAQRKRYPGACQMTVDAIVKGGDWSGKTAQQKARLARWLRMVTGRNGEGLDPSHPMAPAYVGTHPLRFAWSPNLTPPPEE